MRKKLVIIFVIFIMLIVLFKIFIGHYDIRVNIPYNNPIYRLQLNGKYYGMNMAIDKYTHIIPKNLSLIKSTILFTYPSETKIELGEKIAINITGYNCFLGLVPDLIYDGAFTNELSNILAHKGKYQVEIMVEHKPISSRLYFYVEVI